MKIISLAALAVALISSPAFGQAGPAADITVTDAWIRATVPQQKATGAFMHVKSAAGSRIVDVRTSAADVAQVHEMKLEGDVMKMRAVPSLDLPAGKTVDLAPGGYHVMLMQLKQPLQPGNIVPLTLVVEGADGKRSNIDLQVPVRPLNSAAAASSGAMGHMGAPMK